MSAVWLKQYQKGVPAEINPDQFDSIPQLLSESFQKYSSRPAFVNFGKKITYADLDQMASQFAAYLQKDLGLKKGDRIALMMPNILQYPICLFGALRAGLVVVNVNPLYTARELQYQLKDAGAETIVIFANAGHILQACLSETPVKNIITTQIGDMLGFPKGALINFVLKKVKKMVPDYSLPTAIDFKSILHTRKASEFTPVKMVNSDLAFLQYTGGTTGVSKGAMLSHRNMIANLLQAKAWLSPLLDKTPNEQEVIITALPLYHIFSLTANCFTFSYVGGLNVLITNPKDIPGFVKELKKWRFSAFTAVNTLFKALLNHPDFANLDFSKLKVSLGGGMAVQKSTAEMWKLKTGKPLIEAYGLTETSPAACINPMDLPQFNGCIGLPISSTEVRIKNDNEKDLAFGENGEICIKGPQVMVGYWNKPEETAKVMTADGFFKTGDIGFMDENGFVKIMDRKKDMILVSGFNVYPNEVEDVVSGHPKILEVAAVGIPHEHSGEAVKLFIVKKDNSLTEQEVIDYCRQNMVAYKVPKAVEFRDSLPKSNVGKILRKELRVDTKSA